MDSPFFPPLTKEKLLEHAGPDSWRNRGILFLCCLPVCKRLGRTVTAFNLYEHQILSGEPELVTFARLILIWRFHRFSPRPPAVRQTSVRAANLWSWKRLWTFKYWHGREMAQICRFFYCCNIGRGKTVLSDRYRGRNKKKPYLPL